MKDQITKEPNKSLNIYLPEEQKKLLKEESRKRGLTISAFLRSAALEKVNREKFSDRKDFAEFTL